MRRLISLASRSRRSGGDGDSGIWTKPILPSGAALRWRHSADFHRSLILHADPYRGTLTVRHRLERSRAAVSRSRSQRPAWRDAADGRHGSSRSTRSIS